MYWIRDYHIATDELVQRPLDDSRAKELQLKHSGLTFSLEPFPNTPIILQVDGKTVIFRPE